MSKVAHSIRPCLAFDIQTSGGFGYGAESLAAERVKTVCSDYQQCVCPSTSVRQGRNRPTHTTPWPSLNTFEASCSLARLAKQRGGW